MQTCHPPSDADCVAATTFCRVASLFSSICSRCKASCKIPHKCTGNMAFSNRMIRLDRIPSSSHTVSGRTSFRMSDVRRKRNSTRLLLVQSVSVTIWHCQASRSANNECAWVVRLLSLVIIENKNLLRNRLFECRRANAAAGREPKTAFTIEQGQQIT